MRNPSIITLLAAISLALIYQCKSTSNLDRDTAEWRYEIEAENTATQGNYLVKVWTYARKVEDAERQTKKNAVHGVLFKGFPNKSRIKGQKPIVSDPTTVNRHKTFFDDFFKDGGEYARYVSLVHSGSVKPGDIVKIGKEYKVGYVVSVQSSELRKYLEENSIIRSLNDGF